MASSFLSFSLLFITVYTADAYMEFAVDRCEFNSPELEGIRYIYSHYYNKVEYARFDSSVGKYVGYTEFGVKNADAWNKGPELAARKAQRETYCLNNVGNDYQRALSKSVKPYVRLHSVVPPSGGHPSMLVCSVYDFYPKQIRVTWLRDGQEVSSDVTSINELANTDWYYQIHSQMEYTPRSGEKISCMVEHASLQEPLVTDWDPSLPESERNKIAIGASVLILGLILSLAGFIYYKRKSQGWILVPPDPGPALHF
ncbi:H-2 class II histocompatibility antigen, E-S beta chain-like [Thunnus albacares]|uniref:H-2 class II histocompatibility antigen, E-S beta chain-like n=1 Tax=Thunnus albacares TaxID=8236 RepID=UPI001CF67019|nr:H-2 class II histocompatibility antigen, E-S beta chain-like [Thunnus albacares]